MEQAEKLLTEGKRVEGFANYGNMSRGTIFNIDNIPYSMRNPVIQPNSMGRKIFLQNQREITYTDDTKSISSLKIQRTFTDDEAVSTSNSIGNPSIWKRLSSRRPSVNVQCNDTTVASGDTCATTIQKRQPDQFVAAYVYPKIGDKIKILPIKVISVEEFYGVIHEPATADNDNDSGSRTGSPSILDDLLLGMADPEHQQNYRHQKKVGKYLPFCRQIDESIR